MLQTILRPPCTAEDIAQGARLAKMQKRDIGPADVRRVLNSAKLKYVLVGGGTLPTDISDGRAIRSMSMLSCSFQKKHPSQSPRRFRT